MRRTFAALSAVLILALLCGCHGALVRTASTPAPRGRATFAVRWPTRSRLIPAAAESIVVQIKKGATVLQQQVLARPTSGGNGSATFEQLPIGVLTAVATAYPTPGGTGIAQATASTSVTIQPEQNTSFGLTMASTIDHLSVSPSGTITVGKGKTVPLTAAALDAAGNLVLTAALKWSSSAPGVAAVDSAGVVTGVGVGTATITVKETESGKTLAVPLSVLGPASAKSVTYQLNPEHNGVTSFGQTVTFPASAAWSVPLATDSNWHLISYPIVADGRVFVLTSEPVSGSLYGNHLYALDLATGAPLWGPIEIPGVYYSAGQAYDNGKLFVINHDGKVFTFDAATGAPGWTANLPGQYSFESAPVVRNGVLYTGGAGSGGTVYAVDAGTGAILWTASVMNGDHSSPALAADGLFVSYPCQTYKLSLNAGATLWHEDTACSGGGGRTAVYADGKAYVRELFSNSGVIYNAATGARLGTFPMGHIPAVDSTSLYVLGLDGNLTARSLASGAVQWTFAGSGSDTLTAAPMIVDNILFTASSTGVVYALDVASGRTLWTGAAGNPVPHPDEHNAVLLTGLAAAEGYLIVPTGDRLTAFKLIP